MTIDLRRFYPLLLVLTACLVAVPLVANDEDETIGPLIVDDEAVQDKAPPAQTHYKGRRIAQTMHWLGAEWLERQEREKEEGVSLLAGELAAKLKPGMAACDLGCGSGF